MNKISILIILALNISLIFGDCGGQRNENIILTQKPTLLNIVTNGQKYLIKEGTNVLYIANVRGSPFEMGQAYGELFATEIKENLYGLLDHLSAQGLDALSFMP